MRRYVFFIFICLCFFFAFILDFLRHALLHLPLPARVFTELANPSDYGLWLMSSLLSPYSPLWNFVFCVASAYVLSIVAVLAPRQALPNHHQNNTNTAPEHR